MFNKLIPYDIANIVLVAYLRYYHQFKRITKRAKIRFEHRDWHGLQADMKERNSLYRNMVGDTTKEIQQFLNKKKFGRKGWKEVKKMYAQEIRNFTTRNIAETFYNSIYRHFHQGLSADPQQMFVYATGSYREFRSTYPIYHTFDFSESIFATLKRVLSLYSFDAPYQNIERDIGYMTTVFEKHVQQNGVAWEGLRLEILQSIFFRNKAAYVVGRLYITDKPIPFVIPLMHDKNGIYVDTLLLDYNHVSPIFSYYRTYFLVDVDIVRETVDFLRPILPSKGIDEIYNSIGFEKHGKTVFYRDFQKHLLRSVDKFDIAPGIKGMVMSVFTLPSYNMVFKLIKDKFAPPKKVTEQEVKEKYQLVNQHDRVGRMADSHMFQNMVFDKARFSKELLKELKEVAKSKIIITKKTIEIKHLYVEKRMIPLNIYLEEASKKEIRHAIDEYGKAIKELAAVNIFPGDMLLKNFGVTRLRRVVFYDYDEIVYLTDCNFRRIPEARDEYEELSASPYFHVGPNDMFPEEFPRFLIGNPTIKALFLELHGDLFDTPFWRKTQKRLKKGEIIEVFPYAQKLRFRNGH